MHAQAPGQLSPGAHTSWLAFTWLQANAFSSVATLRLLGGLLAPYCSMLKYSTRLTEMRRLVNDIIAPIAAQLAQQKHSQLAKLGCTVEEAPPGSVPADGKGISVAVGSQRSHSNGSSSSSNVQAAPGGAAADGSNHAVTQPVPVVAMGGTGPVKQRKGLKGSSSATAGGTKSSSKAAMSATTSSSSAASKVPDSHSGQALSHKRFESGMWLYTLGSPQHISRDCQKLGASSSCLHCSL